MKSLPEFIDLVRRERSAVLMGVLNATPDSFFDGGRYTERSAIESRIDRLLAEGADIIDIGGESTRPAAEPVPAEEQLARIAPAVDYALSRGAIVSVDTTLPEVAQRCVDQGVQIINDVSCLANPALARITAEAGASLILMHSRGSMTSMPGFGAYREDGYEDVVLDVEREWLDKRARAESEGLAPEAIWFDPGLGFHKSAQQSWDLLRRTEHFVALGHVVCVGASRKSFIGALDGSTPEERLGGTVAACLFAVARGAQVLRVHDVATIRQALAARRTLEAGHDWGPELRLPSRRPSTRVKHDA